MQRIGEFQKVSFEQFQKDFEKQFGDLFNTKEIYDNIRLPKRATKGSAGYDFYVPIPIFLSPEKSVKIPTGIRAKMEDGWVLQIYPRSSLGFKHRMQIDNTVAIIDQDYYYSDNEGHIFIKITNDTKEDYENLLIKSGDAFVQGIFVQYGITLDDDVSEIRNGGIGSTNGIL